MSLLIIVNPSGERSAIVLDANQRYRLGRSTQNEIVLRHPQVSRFHGELFVENERWHIRDCGSSNGTRIDGVRIVEDVAMPADGHIAIGEFTLRIQQRDEIDGDPADEMATYDDKETFDQSAGEPAVVISTAKLLRFDPATDPGTAANVESIRRRLGRDDAGQEPIEPTDDALVSLLGLVIEMIGPDRAAVIGQREDGSFRVRAFQSTDGSTAMRIGKTIARTALLQRAAILTDDARRDPRFAEATGDIGARSLMVVPLGGGEAPTSVLYVDSLASRRRFRQNDLKLLTMLANIDAVRTDPD